MIIRFLDKQNKCYQVDTKEVPTLVYYESEAEVHYAHNVQPGDCFISVPKKFDEQQTKQKLECLNTKNEPINLKS